MTGVKQSQLLVLRLSLEFDKIPTKMHQQMARQELLRQHKVSHEWYEMLIAGNARLLIEMHNDQ